jgi:hypothetical protein
MVNPARRARVVNPSRMDSTMRVARRAFLYPTSRVSNSCMSDWNSGLTDILQMKKKG